MSQRHLLCPVIKKKQQQNNPFNSAVSDKVHHSPPRELGLSFHLPPSIHLSINPSILLVLRWALLFLSHPPLSLLTFDYLSLPSGGGGLTLPSQTNYNHVCCHNKKQTHKWLTVNPRCPCPSPSPLPSPVPPFAPHPGVPLGSPTLFLLSSCCPQSSHLQQFPPQTVPGHKQTQTPIRPH